jgi:hypothetical protein
MFPEAPVRAGVSATKGPAPLNTPALSRASRRKPEIVPRHPSAKETLRTVLARLEDMKAEDSVVIDLTGKSSIGDYMVVTSGRSQRHVSAVADNLIGAGKTRVVPASVPRACGKGTGVDRRRRRHRAPLPAEVGPSQSWKRCGRREKLSLRLVRTGAHFQDHGPRRNKQDGSRGPGWRDVRRCRHRTSNRARKPS